MTSKLPELLECPFCGGEAYIADVGHGYFGAECLACSSANGVSYGNDSACKAWNTRHHSVSRDRAIARAVAKAMFNKGFFAHADIYMAKSLSEVLELNPDTLIDDYLQSDEFKELVK